MVVKNLQDYDTKEFLVIKNVYQNNLKHLDLVIPHYKLIVVTGVSGSGKSSLVFETLYEEGRRRYVESLSAYVRQFLGKMKKPLVDYIKGLPPAIAIEQKKSSGNSRSTVGTVTELYHYLKVLYARLGKTYSPVSGNEVKKQSVDDVTDFILSLEENSKIIILAPFLRSEKRKWAEELALLLQKGFTRLYINREILKIEEIQDKLNQGSKKEITTFQNQLDESCAILIDRLVIEKTDGGLENRIADSVQTAYYESKGRCIIDVELSMDNYQLFHFSNSFEADGIYFEEPSPDLFSFNSPHGACPACHGFGNLLGIDEDKVIPDKTLSLYDGAVACWEGEKMSLWKQDFIKNSSKSNFPIFKPYYQLTREERKLLWDGDGQAEGINNFFDYLESNNYKVHYRIFMSRFRGKTACRTCEGTRLRKEAGYIKIEGRSISDLVNIPLDKLMVFFDELNVKYADNKVAKRLLYEINTRMKMMSDIGLGYLTLNRNSKTLSGGELQRIQIIYSIGSNLTGAMYILDEPSIGLHPRDTEQLLKILNNLKELGNSVIVVEHDEDIIRAADEIIDLGPLAGFHGGELVFQGKINGKADDSNSLTMQYLNGKIGIPVPLPRRKLKSFIEIKGATKHNLKNFDVKIPLTAMTVVTGVSGSGKSTLVHDVIFESFKNEITPYTPDPRNCRKIEGDFKRILRAEFIGQDSIDRSRRSNAVTYVKVYDHIRELMSAQQASKINGFPPAYFSFNVEGGRCEECKGEGNITVEMQFVADMHLQCESCKGRRFKEEILDVTYQGKNIDEILQLTVNEAIDFFAPHKAIITGLQPLMTVGLNYLKLGQPTSTLSGGESQRLKLASFLSKGTKYEEPVLFIFDEPTTGLHWNDISKLLNAFNALIDIGHTVLVIEHNLEVIKCADYIIDLGPEGGEEGGMVVFEGRPEELVKVKKSYTAKYLAKKLSL